MPRPSPSDSEPRMVSGPTQKSSDAVSHPSMKRSRARWSCPVSSAPTRVGRRASRCWMRAGQPLEPLLDPEQRPGDAPDEQAAEDDEDRGAGADGRRERRVGDAERREPGHEQGGEAEAVGDDRPGAPGQAVADRHAEQRPDHDRHDVDEGPETGEGAVHAGHPRRRFQPILWTPSRRARPSPRVWSWSRVLDRNVTSGWGPGRRCPVKEEFVSRPQVSVQPVTVELQPRSPSCGGRPASRAAPPPTRPCVPPPRPDRRRARP